MKVFWAHSSNLILAFITFFVISALVIGIVYLCSCFLFWTVPQIPSVDSLYFFGRASILVSLFLTLVYSTTETYKKSVLIYLT